MTAVWLLLKGISWQVWAGIALVAALGFTHLRAYQHGKDVGHDAVQADWDADKVQREAAQQAADERERLKSHAAALSYEKDRAVAVTRFAPITKELNDATDAAPAWRDQPVPDGVRRAIAAAGAALAASQPDGALRVPAAGGADERAIGPGLREGAREPRRLLEAASAPR